MNLSAALGIYLIIVLGLIIIFIRSNIKTFSAVVMSLLIGQIILNFMAPPYIIDPWECQNSIIATYYLVQIITPVIVIIYVFAKGLKDNK